jgi:hypothetical protein
LKVKTLRSGEHFEDILDATLITNDEQSTWLVK